MQTTTRRPLLWVTLLFGVIAAGNLAGAYGLSVCGCTACAVGADCIYYSDTELDFQGLGNEDEATAPSEFRIATRWTSTSASSGFSSRGTPKHLTWTIVQDGTAIAGSEGTSGSDLIAMLNRQYRSNTSVEDSTWFRLFEDSFDRWSQLSGLTFAYEPNDGREAIDNTSTPRGDPGVTADIRVGGHSIDGASGSNVLAYNYFPPHGDMVIDTDNASFYGNRFGDSLRLRNVLMHEIGHGLGFRHLESSDGEFLMEPFISVAFDGPQLDDILAAHRNYGDAYEKNGGNDLPSTATPIGSFEAGQLWQIGADADGARVEPDETDFVSIDGLSDSDWFRFTVDTPLRVAALLSPRGPSYQEGPQNGAQSQLNTTRLADLRIELYEQPTIGGNIAQVAESNLASVGGTELITGVTVQPGSDYLVRIQAGADNVQLYNLILGFTELMIPEPSAAFLAALSLCGTIVRGRSR